MIKTRSGQFPMKQSERTDRALRITQIWLIIIGIFFCWFSSHFLDSPSKVANLFLRPTNLRKKIESCDETITAKNLADDGYEVYLEFPDALLNEKQREYFDLTRDRTDSAYFWETEQIHAGFDCRYGSGRRVDLVIQNERPGFIFSKQFTGQKVGGLSNKDGRENDVSISIHIDTNCERLLSLQPSLRLRSTNSKDIELARFGISLLITTIILGIIRIGARRRAAVVE